MQTLAKYETFLNLRTAKGLGLTVPASLLIAADALIDAEALSGLARALFYVGARSLIVFHWSVSDEVTARLRIGTFRTSARDPKLSHAEALRQSMLAMIDAAKSDAEADPRLWAPFVVVGEPAKPQ